MRLEYAVCSCFLLILLSSCATSLTKSTMELENKHQGFTGLVVMDANTGKLLEEYQGHKSFTPASNTKILSLLTAVHILDDTTFTFHYRQVVDSLIFQATGNPGLLHPEITTKDAFGFLRESKKPIYYQQANWNQEFYGEGWSWDDLNYSFSPQISAIPVYGNLAAYTTENFSIEIVPEIFRDSIHLLKNSDLKKLDIPYTPHTSSKPQQPYTGKVPFQTSEALSIKIIESIIDKPIKIISTNHKLNQGVKGVAADTLYKKMMHQSDNLIAEQLLIMSAMKLSDTMDNRIAIKYAQKTIFESLPDVYQWVDGSGLSRYNQNTPYNMALILQQLFKVKGIDWVTGIFPTAGKHGTLANLQIEEPVIVYAKSGSLKNNYSLSGYLKTRKNRLIIFSIMNSNHMLSGSEIRSAVSKVVQSIGNRY